MLIRTIERTCVVDSLLHIYVASGPGEGAVADHCVLLRVEEGAHGRVVLERLLGHLRTEKRKEERRKEGHKLNAIFHPRHSPISNIVCLTQ